MNLMDVVCILIILLFMVLGFKRGVIKSIVQLFGMIAVLIISFVFKDLLAGVLMQYLPFFNFGGIFEGITSINILVYDMISFLVIFVLLYCILSIIINLAGLVEKLLKLTVILAIPSKILGAILGLIEGIIVAFIVMFVLFHLPQTEQMVGDSKFAIIILERSPFMSNMAVNTTLSLEEIDTILEEAKDAEDKSDANFKVLQILITYDLITKEGAQSLIDANKINFNKDIVLQ